MLLGPITERYFQADSEISISRIYDEICAHEKDRTELLQQDIALLFNNSKKTFEDLEGEDRELLQSFAFICSLSFDVYVKKLLIEKLIDELPAKPEKEKDKEKDKEKKKGSATK